MSMQIRVGNTDEFQSTHVKRVEVDGTIVAIFKVANQFYAVEDHCPHAGYTLHDGEVEGTTVFCLLHGAQFDLTTGKWIGGHACSDIPNYPLSIDKDEDIWLEYKSVDSRS